MFSLATSSNTDRNRLCNSVTPMLSCGTPPSKCIPIYTILHILLFTRGQPGLRKGKVSSLQFRAPLQQLPQVVVDALHPEVRLALERASHVARRGARPSSTSTSARMNCSGLLSADANLGMGRVHGAPHLAALHLDEALLARAGSRLSMS